MTTPLNPQSDFNEITQLIQATRQRAVQAVNTVLIDRPDVFLDICCLQTAYAMSS